MSRLSLAGGSSLMLVVLCAALILSFSSAAEAQDILGGSVLPQELQMIYDGSALTATHMQLQNWGSGITEESKVNTIGDFSVMVVSRGLYSGGRIVFDQPLDLTRSFNDPAGYLQMNVRFLPPDTGAMGAPGLPGAGPGLAGPYGSSAAPQTAPFGGGGISGPMGGAGGGGGASVFAGMRMPGSDDDEGAMPVPGAAGQFGRPMTMAVKATTKVQVELHMEGGQILRRAVDLSWFSIPYEGWSVLAWPLASLKGDLDLQSYKVKSIVIGGDGTEPIWVGQILTVKDTSPLRPDAGGDKEVSRNFDAGFIGSAMGTLSGAKFYWDFDKSDGIQEDFVGSFAGYNFRNEGTYTVTLTVKDPFGIKKPASSTATVTVYE